mmetsp:Transcript_30356/g.56917  ORF Transcript_30356/g.56917 Transcript_30356/m.56917 type:complete len:360 (+) Transcript_30356:123-1202(+)
MLQILDQVQNVGQVMEIAQSAVYQKEQVRWSRRAYQLESQSVRLDVFDHVKEEIRSHHDTYMGRIDALLLVLALIWPFALNAIQFSDPFIPQTEMECEDCIEVQHKSLVMIWMTLMGAILILPFWGILMLIRCKLKLDSWLEYSLARLSHARRGMNIAPQTRPSPHSKERPESEADDDEHDDTKEIVCKLVNMVAECQEFLGIMWTEECGWLVHASTSLLWISAGAALLLTALSVWIFMMNKGGSHAMFGNWFALIVGLGILVPLIYVLSRPWDELGPSDGTSLAAAVSNPALNEPAARRRRASLIKGNSSPNFSRFEEPYSKRTEEPTKRGLIGLLQKFRLCRHRQRRQDTEPLLTQR